MKNKTYPFPEWVKVAIIAICVAITYFCYRGYPKAAENTKQFLVAIGTISILGIVLCIGSLIRVWYMNKKQSS